MKSTFVTRGRLPTSFDALAEVMIPHAIIDDIDYDNTAEFVSQLAVIAKPTRGQQQYLNTLVQLIEAYDREHNSIDSSEIGPIELLRSLLSEHGMNASDLGRLLGNRELGSKILRGDRKLSKANIRKLAEHFKLSPAAFIE